MILNKSPDRSVGDVFEGMDSHYGSFSPKKKMLFSSLSKLITHFGVWSVCVCVFESINWITCDDDSGFLDLCIFALVIGLGSSRIIRKGRNSSDLRRNPATGVFEIEVFFGILGVDCIHSQKLESGAIRRSKRRTDYFSNSQPTTQFLSADKTNYPFPDRLSYEPANWIWTFVWINIHKLCWDIYTGSCPGCINRETWQGQ
ncbi:unnamed protein product [Allacma fusca]|uniref:Uncharacterized protein n=1 Tax=Allacma fusca TaxID=39272 RepID=A0A8J2KUN8_9HEXA|nr:unnamed protein product [Allacma fusca]